MGGLEHLFPYIGNVIIPTDFSEGLKPPTRFGWICLRDFEKTTNWDPRLVQEEKWKILPPDIGI